MFKFAFYIFLFFIMSLQLKAEVINDVKIINNERISKDTILIFADIKIGDDYDQNDLNKILKEKKIRKILQDR